MFFFVFLGFLVGGFGKAFASRLLRKGKENVPKGAGKDPPEARICGSSRDPRKRPSTRVDRVTRMKNHRKT